MSSYRRSCPFSPDEMSAGAGAGAAGAGAAGVGGATSAGFGARRALWTVGPLALASPGTYSIGLNISSERALLKPEMKDLRYSAWRTWLDAM